MFPFQKNEVPPADAKLNGALGTRATVSVVVVPLRFTVLPKEFQPKPAMFDPLHTAALPLERICTTEVYAVLARLFPIRTSPLALSNGAFPGCGVAPAESVICPLDDESNVANAPIGTFTSFGLVTAAVAVGI
jgi:hypothetical protein